MIRGFGGLGVGDFGPLQAIFEYGIYIHGEIGKKGSEQTMRKNELGWVQLWESELVTIPRAHLLGGFGGCYIEDRFSCECCSPPCFW
jgi:hypothetical protein